jgi:hypothetical protein
VSKYPAIPEPASNEESRDQVIRALKEVAELITGQRGSAFSHKALTWEDLIAAGIIAREDVPR